MKFRLEMCHSEVSLARPMFHFISILFSLGELLYWRPILIKEASFHYHFHCICNGTNTKNKEVKVQDPRPTGHGSSWVLLAPPGCSWLLVALQLSNHQTGGGGLGGGWRGRLTRGRVQWERGALKPNLLWGALSPNWIPELVYM